MFFHGCICAGRSGCGAAGNTYAIADRNAGAFRYGDANSITEPNADGKSNAHSDAQKIPFAHAHPNSVGAGSNADAVARRLAQSVTNTASRLVDGFGSARASGVARAFYALNESGNGAKTPGIARKSGFADTAA